MPVTALRYHNVYGPRMPRDTPYAGVAAIFASALAAGRPPRVFEDGGSCGTSCTSATSPAPTVLALTAADPAAGAFNVASGTPRTVGEMAEALADAAGADAPRPRGHRRVPARGCSPRVRLRRTRGRVLGFGRPRTSTPGWPSSPGPAARGLSSPQSVVCTSVPPVSRSPAVGRGTRGRGAWRLSRRPRAPQTPWPVGQRPRRRTATPSHQQPPGEIAMFGDAAGGQLAAGAEAEDDREED